jgi:hypothetical protein
MFSPRALASSPTRTVTTFLSLRVRSVYISIAPRYMPANRCFQNISDSTYLTGYSNICMST